ncbi:1,3-beta-glucanase [Nocardioides guangzhouensis]|uniref:glucan endo-1,3-beta-D-glucosidase n=1 Tax=Nocardioides guangzhouensis TaxID=2497878 RepID=A0A4Q4Z4D8_9ACTN|nr:glycosyl hydrolase [Nocardioides guangzhouensis]RYP81851.1 1,3-beta-glucanase [Nocardioides guangzhouensis]
MARARVALLLGVLVLAGCSSSPAADPDGPDRSGAPAAGAPLPHSEVAPLVQAQTRRALADLPTTRLAPGLLPPTNKWFSGLVFGDEPQPVFPLPLAFTIDARSFGFGLPQVVTSADAIVGSHQRDVSVTAQGSTRQRVSAYDDASVTMQARDAAGATLGRTTVAEGSPYVTHRAARREVLRTSVPFTGSGATRTATTPTGTYAVRLDDATVRGRRIALAKGGSAVFFPVPAGRSPGELARRAVPLTGAATTWSVAADTVTTSVRYRTAGGARTAYGVLPHQRGSLTGDSSCTLGSFPTVLGELTLCEGTGPTWTAPRQDARAGLDLSGLDGEQRDEIASQVRADLAASADLPADSYFGGKALYRLSQLLALADEVGADDAAADAAAALTTALRTWTEPQGCARRVERCFVYDPQWKGVVGQAPAFGSETFNDHHFHYGYFLYAAGVLGLHDPDVVDDLRPVMTLLAADVAGGSDTGLSPRLRVFDSWASHSWASGTSPFADGNNQESSSEAVTAWAGLRLWADAAGDDLLARQATWLMSSEAAAARAYWTGFDTDQPIYDGFAHGVVGIGWGGKRDHATWFSAEPTAVLGIQVIPMSPSSDYLAADPDRVIANVEAATRAGGYADQLGDYVLMYSALGGCDAAHDALTKARTLPDDAIDDGNSRSYLLAFLVARRC